MTASDTSRENYRRYYDRLDTIRFQVYDMICREPGLDDISYARLMNMEINSITPRIHELAEAGLVDIRRGENVKGNTARRTFPRAL